MPDERQQAARAEQVNIAAKEATLLTLNEAAPILGVSVRTLYDYARKGKIKAVKFANKWRVSAAALKDAATSDNTAASDSTAPTSKTKKPRGKLAVLIRDFDELRALAVDSAERLAQHVAALTDLRDSANILRDRQLFEKLLDTAKATQDGADKMVEICDRVAAMLKGKTEK